MERYDIAIIGTGPAGLEAAITAKVRNKNILLLGNDRLSSKIEKAHTIQNYLGLPELSGDVMMKNFKDHLEKMDIQITNDQITAVYAMGKYFALQGKTQMYEADTVILACGVSVQKPFPGEIENLGRGVSYCATCDGALYRGKSTVVIGYSRDEEKEAEFLADLAKEVIYIPMYKETPDLSEKIIIKEGVIPQSIEKTEDGLVLNSNFEKIETDGIFILRESILPSQLVPGLKLDGNRVEVDRSLNTNIKGLFACGDITGTPYQYIKAAGEGNVAALSAVSYLDKK